MIMGDVIKVNNDFKELSASSNKLLDVCTIIFIRQNRAAGNKLNTIVTIPLQRYMEMRGIPITKSSKDKIRRKVKEDLETLYHISLEWAENRGGKKNAFSKTRICYEVKIDRGNIIFVFSESIAEYLNTAYLMQRPLEISSAFHAVVMNLQCWCS